MGKKHNTLSKAIREGRLTLAPISPTEKTVTLSKTDRMVVDDQTGMGKACTLSVDRVLATKIGATASASFSENIDVHFAGILLSLPALIANGLLEHREEFQPERGYYSIESIFISLAILALLRVETLARSGRIPCGELGRQ